MRSLRLSIGVATVLTLGLAVFVGANSIDSSNAQSPYVSQLDSPVRGLSAQEVDDLLNGRGSGYALTAELNSYPGPKHVLELEQDLDLSPEQRQQIETIFRQMNTEAKQVGQEIVELERQFSDVFAQGGATKSDIEEQTQQLAVLYGQYRSIHLKPHLEVRQVLSPEQIATYNQLRGYSDSSMQTAPSHPMHH